MNGLLGSFNCPAETFPLPGTTVSLGPATVRNEDQPPTALGHRMVIHGISVLHDAAGPGGTYIVPSLGVEISLGGLLGQRVLHTLTRSPRSVVLVKGSAPSVPSSWSSVSVTFAGLTFSVPAFWPIQRPSGAAFGLGSPCATPGVAFPDNTAGLLSSGVTLSTDLHLLPPPSCPAETDPDAPQPPMDGVQVDSGRLAQFHVSLSFSAPCLDLHGLTACPATSPDYSILVLRVAVPGRTKPVFVSIGLAGNGRSLGPSCTRCERREGRDTQVHSGGDGSLDVGACSSLQQGAGDPPDDPDRLRHRKGVCRCLRGSPTPSTG